MLLRTRPAQAGRPLVRQLVDGVRPAHLALGRSGIGAVMVGAPRVVPQALGVDSATATQMAWAVRMLGAREIAMGLGTLAALRGGDRRAARLWVAGGVLADAVDALAVAGALSRGRLRGSTGLGLVLTASAAAALGVRALQEPEVPPL